MKLAWAPLNNLTPHLPSPSVQSPSQQCLPASSSGPVCYDSYPLWLHLQVDSGWYAWTSASLCLFTALSQLFSTQTIWALSDYINTQIHGVCLSFLSFVVASLSQENRFPSFSSMCNKDHDPISAILSLFMAVLNLCICSFIFSK